MGAVGLAALILRRHEIAAWMGHADSSMTYKTYVHARPEDLAEALDALNHKAA